MHEVSATLDLTLDSLTFHIVRGCTPEQHADTDTDV